MEELLEGKVDSEQSPVNVDEDKFVQITRDLGSRIKW